MRMNGQRNADAHLYSMQLWALSENASRGTGFQPVLGPHCENFAESKMSFTHGPTSMGWKPMPRSRFSDRAASNDAEAPLGFGVCHRRGGRLRGDCGGF